ncbi:MAG: hypothetical protein EP340_07010 [Alphaproteobacteria bacterium]|nr:MAG: hypothetical protein EP340_07010 [Alphaproteobacteria bacterium]
MNNLFEEFKRRNIFRVGIAYLVMAWLVLQVGAIVAPALSLPEWTLSFIIFILVTGLPIALIFAWAFEMTPQGLKRTQEVDLTESVTAETGKKLNRIIIGILCLAVVALLVDRFVFGGADPAEKDREAEDAGGPYESIAVLPFVNMSDDTAQDYFSDGISEELLNLLAKQRGLRVAARTSSFAYKGHNKDIKEIGQDLNVDTVLEGSVRKSGPKIRITAQLIEADTGYHLWSNTYDRELNDIFAIQDEISEAIVGALQVHFNGETAEPTAKSKVTNLEAYNAYLKGQHNLQKRNKEALYLALSNFDLAISYDPTYAPAYSGKADAYLLLADSGSSYGDIPVEQAAMLAEPVIERGLELDPSLAEVYASKGLLLNTIDKPSQAVEALTHAIELSPNLSRAYLWRGLAYGGLYERQLEIKDMETANLLDPLSLPPLSNLLNRYLDVGEIDKAQQKFDDIGRLTGDKADRFKVGEVNILAKRGELAQSYQVALDLYEASDEELWVSVVFALWRLGEFEKSVEFISGNSFFQYRAWLLSGQIEKADAIREDFLADPERPPEARAISAMYMAYHETDPEKFAAYLSEFKDIDLSLDGPIFDERPDRLNVSSIAYVFHRAGRMDELETVLSNLQSYIDLYKPKGYHLDLLTEEICLYILRGQHQEALALIRSGLAKNELRYAFFTSREAELLNGNEEFEELRRDFMTHLNAERAKLGWAPLELPTN